MGEIIGAIVGALLGGFFTWLLTRRRPHHIVCDEEFRGTFALGVPETRILYRDVPVEKLGVIRLNFRNVGSQVIESPRLTVRLDEDVQVLDVLASMSPERGIVGFEDQREAQSGEGTSQQELPVKTIVKTNSVQVLADRLNPYSLNQETVTVDIFAGGEIKKVDVLGSGVLRDGTGWSVSFQPWREIQARRVRRMNVFNKVNFYALLLLGITYLIWRPPLGILSINMSTASGWLRDPILWILVAWGLLFLAWAFYWGLRGWVLYLPMPFFGRRVRISFERRQRG